MYTKLDIKSHPQLLFHRGKASQLSPELADMITLSIQLVLGNSCEPLQLPTIYMDLGKGDLNSGSHICTTSSLTLEPSPSPEKFSRLCSLLTP